MTYKKFKKSSSSAAIRFGVKLHFFFENANERNVDVNAKSGASSEPCV